MVARALAKSCSRSDLSKELDCCLMDIIEKVKAVKCMDRAIVNERPKNVAQFDLHDEKTDNSYPVFLCAAGRGLTIEDDKPWKHAVHHDDLLRLKDDDFFVLIMGDSMSPRIPNGAIIAVRRQDTIDPDGIGIFDINNEETMCKRLIERKNDGVRLLRSCNQDGERFPDIVLNESTTARCRGRVLINPSSRKPFMWFPQTERKDIP